MPCQEYISAILLAGGKGLRMDNLVPKQFLPLCGKPMALYSLETLCSHSEIKEIIIVCDPIYKPLFQTYPNLQFAPPGGERQDSLFQGLCVASPLTTLVCVHDAARPLLSKKDLDRVLQEAKIHRAAILASPERYTLKQASPHGFVANTLDRSLLWEAHTPQIAPKNLLQQAYLKAREKNLRATDEASLMELLDHPVKLVSGSAHNIKITTPEDWKLAEALLAL